MSDDEMLTKLLALNLERAAEGSASAGEHPRAKHASLEYSSTTCRTDPSGQEEDRVS
jgi:hypothetical protein